MYLGVQEKTYKINKYSVTFVDKEGNAITGIDTQSVEYLGKATEPNAELVPEVTGYTFDGWYLADGTKYDFNTEVKSDIELKATYKTQCLYMAV